MGGNAPRMRTSLDAVPVFEAGVSGFGPVKHRMNFNENPFGPLPSVLDVVRETAAGLNRYPDMLNSSLIETIAEHFGVAQESVAVGGGGAAVLQQLLLAAVDQGDEVVFPWRSFEAYPILTSVVGARQVRVPLSGVDQDLESMLGAITDRTRLVFLCNPNNPTSTAIDHDALDGFIDRAPEHVLIVLDEAYREFVRAPEVPDGIRRYGDRPNVAVLRTFSKAYGLAGLRVAFTVAHPTVARAVRKTALPFGVTRLAERAAQASLRASDELFARVETIVKERERMESTLRAQGWPVARSETNFLWLPMKARSADFGEACRRDGVLVRAFPDEGVRITVDEERANDIVLSIAQEFARS
ncbi:histidinol-phosphate transaminase [Planotetraspora mira]